MKRSITHIVASLLLALSLLGCARSYSSIHFSYPPSSAPHEDNWTYSGLILAWDPLGKRPTEKGIRKIEIRIKDKDNKVVLKDQLELDCASIDRKIHWEKFDNLTIELFERGNEYAEDEYNRGLVKEGPKHLLTLKYHWNGTRFKRSTEPSYAPDIDPRAVREKAST